MNPVRLAGGVASLFFLALVPSLLTPAHVSAQAAPARDRIASKSISRVQAVDRVVFALDEDGRSFSWLNLFTSPEDVRTVEWPWYGPASTGAAWRQSMLLRASYDLSDSQRVVRIAAAPAAALVNETPLPIRSDSLIFKDTSLATANGGGLTAIAVKGDTALLGFGRLGIAYTRLDTASGSGAIPTRDSLVTFFGLPGLDSNARALTTCRWNRACRSDTVTIPFGGLDSVISVAIDASVPESTWILIATRKGIRRGAWKGTSFPYVQLPGIPDTAPEPARSVFASPTANRIWAFTQTKFFYSDDHGRTFRVPPQSPFTGVASSLFTGYSSSLAPQVAFSGDTSFINFNMTAAGAVGIARFRRDTLLANTAGTGLDQVLINANDGLGISASDVSLTGITVARNGNAAVLVTGTSLEGVFYRRLDLADPNFMNLTSRISLKNGLAEVITYPTLFEGPSSVDAPFVRIGYRLKKSGKVTITIYNYAMEKVKVIVRNAPRQGGIPRSENIGEDRWDGRDSGGRLVSVGTYYVRVESDQGEAAFGKIICVRGRR
jgi:hypothetical protein